MTRHLILAVAVLAMTGCAAIRDLRNDEKPYEKPPFYAKYLTTGSALDAQITRTLVALREDPSSPELHNNLGALLIEKGFPNDAAREFERAINADTRYYPAWYNLGLVRASQNDELGARRAFARTVDLKPGHAAALFQLGLVEEKREHTDRAIDLYAKAYGINPALLDVTVNPRILDTKLTHLALLRLYPTQHAQRSMQFQGVAPVTQPTAPAQTAPSPQPAPGKILTPAAPATDPARQRTPANPATTPAPRPTPPPTRPPGK
ncbi:MAG: tetratricopeptide repeat protein [Thermoanaerobaculia bacterium]